MKESMEEDYTLTNPAPRPAVWRGRQPENTRQTVLLTGMDCLPGQRELFEIDGQAARTCEDK
jgi:hypothetical protein